MPSLLDPSLAPEGHHVIHAYTAGNEPYHLWEPFEGDRDASTEAAYQALKVRAMPMRHAPCTVHHAPCTMHHAPCTRTWHMRMYMLTHTHVRKHKWKPRPSERSVQGSTASRQRRGR